MAKAANRDLTTALSGLYGTGNQTGTDVRFGQNDLYGQTKTAAQAAAAAPAAAAPAAAQAPTAPTAPTAATAKDEAVKAGLAGFSGVTTAASAPGDERVKAGVKPTGTGAGGGGTVVDPAAAEYAQRIAEAYARTQPGSAPAWEDQWAPQIEAMQGQRYGPYDSKYLPQIDGLLDRILNRGDFAYNWSDDPLYRQYAARYQQQARQGMQDTMGQAAALTGGYGSSYATAAGNQAYAQQMQGLNDRAMELYQLAKDRWDTQGTEMRSNLAALENREASNRAYYQDDRDTFYNRNDADIANLRDSQAMGWAAYQDAADREMAERQMAWDMYQYWNNLYENKYAGKTGGGGGGRKAAAAADDGATGLAEKLAADRMTQQALQQIADDKERRKKTKPQPSSTGTAGGRWLMMTK